MLFIPSESQVLRTAIADGLEGDFDYCEFGGFKGTVSIATGKLTITLKHPSMTIIDTRLKAKYESFVDELTASNQQIRLVCPLSVASIFIILVVMYYLFVCRGECRGDCKTA